MEHELMEVTAEKERKKIINRLKRDKKWLLNDDYLALIWYKQLSLSKKPSIPSTLAPRKHQWETVYDAMNHPSEPIRPANYVSAVSVDNEDDVDGDIVGLSVYDVIILWCYTYPIVCCIHVYLYHNHVL